MTGTDGADASAVETEVSGGLEHLPAVLENVDEGGGGEVPDHDADYHSDSGDVGLNSTCDSPTLNNSNVNALDTDGTACTSLGHAHVYSNEPYPTDPHLFRNQSLSVD